MINTLRLTHLIYLGWVRLHVSVYIDHPQAHIENRVFTIVKTRFTKWAEDGQCRPKHVAPPNLNKLDVLDVKCLSFNSKISQGFTSERSRNKTKIHRNFLINLQFNLLCYLRKGEYSRFKDEQ